MTIKAKLITNMVVGGIAVWAIVIMSVFGMNFIKGKLSYLTQKSTPYQVKNIELQKEIQGAIADLVKVNTANTDKEFTTYKSEALKSLESIKSTQQALEEISASKLNVHEELSSISSEIYTAVSNKISSKRTASSAADTISKRMQESSARLKELDKRVKLLQTGKANSFSAAMKDTGNFSSRLRSIEDLRNLIKDMQLIFVNVQNAQKSTHVLIAKGKVNSVVSRIQKNDYLIDTPAIEKDLKTIETLLYDFIKLQSAAIAAKDDSSKREAAVEAGKDLGEKLNALYLTLDQEATLASEKVGIESKKQGDIYGQSNSANSILLDNSELVSLGLMVEGETIRLFNLESIKEIDSSSVQIQSLFKKINDKGVSVEKSLQKLGATSDLKTVKSALMSLSTIRNELFADKGIVAALKSRISANEEVIKASEKLREVVLKQSEKGKETVSAAKGEQEKAIASVNKMVKTIIILLIIIGSVAAIIGTFFGILSFRSVIKPLNELVNVAESVADGDLTDKEIRSKNDEFGKVLQAVGKMVINLRSMAEKITDSTRTIAGKAEELSSTALEVEQNSQTQSGQIVQSVTAMTEMVQTIQDVSINAANTSDAAGKMKQLAADGDKALATTSRELSSFAEIVRDSAEKIDALGRKSEAINEIVGLIKDIADQTNLLALNAAIEAARAGEQGRGFAVVADSVRQLAQRTIESSNEISLTVSQMKSEVDSSVVVMQKERTAIDNIMAQVERTQSSMSEIVTCVDQVFDMIQTIATATEEQSATAEDVNRNIHGINEITETLSGSVNKIAEASENFTRLAEDLKKMAGWFRL